MITVEDALARVLALAADPVPEILPLIKASGRWMTKPATARRDQPPFAASAMDGYGVSGEASVGASFRVIGEAGAGHGFAGQLRPGEAVRIFTGAPVPDGVKSVVIQEDISREGDRITVTALQSGKNIRPQGNDFRTGQTVSPRLLSPNDVALLAAMNIPEVTVARRPVVAFIATGDELVMPGEVPGPDQIIASNTFALHAMARAAGAQARMLPIARDTEADLAAVLSMALDADLIVTVGGASVGDHDLVGRVAQSMGLERAFYQIAMRPGKPLMAGRLRGVPMLGLPGNPVSAIVCGHLFLLPLIRAMQGAPAPGPVEHRAILAEDTGPAGPRTHYMRAKVTRTGGMPQITPFSDQDSALLGVLSQADALLIRPKDGPALTAGAEVTFLPI